MLRNFFKIAIRNLFRHKTFSILNLTGLSLGIACGVLLTLHIKEELSYDKSFPGAEKIYRLVTTEWSKSHPPLAGEMQRFFPEIENIVRFADAGEAVTDFPVKLLYTGNTEMYKTTASKPAKEVSNTASPRN